MKWAQKSRMTSAICAVPLLLLGNVAIPAPAQQLVLVEDGVSRAPIVLFEGAPPKTRQAAAELAAYIEKTSGASPKLIEGKPEPLPQHAIWVGYQPALEELFPDLDFDFDHQEEVLIAANEDHLVIAGRDRWDNDHLVVEGRDRTINGWQREYGTANAVYTFLQDKLDVRWIMPGEFGVDIIENETIAFEPFTYRHHPPFLERASILRFSRLGDARRHSHDWARFQRLQLDSMSAPGGHPASDWWEKYHEEHSDYREFMASPDLRLGSAGRLTTIKVAKQVYTPQFLDQAKGVLQKATAKVADQPEPIQKRVAFVRAGFEFTRLMMECIPLMEQVRESNGRDTDAVRQAAANWERIEEIADEASPHGFWFLIISSRMQDGYMGDMADYLGPPAEKYLDKINE